MKVKLFDEEHEKDLEDSINVFLKGDVEVIDIKYQVSVCGLGDDQIFCVIISKWKNTLLSVYNIYMFE